MTKTILFTSAVTAACFVLIIAGCTPRQLAVATDVAPAATRIGLTTDPAIGTDVAKACVAASAGLDVAAAAAKGGAADTVANLNNLVTASCGTPEAQAQLVQNDLNPVQPDGGSAAWLQGLVQAAKIAVTVATVL